MNADHRAALDALAEWVKLAKSLGDESQPEEPYQVWLDEMTLGTIDTLLQAEVQT